MTMTMAARGKRAARARPIIARSMMTTTTIVARE
jgi:hypothetical protein